MMITHAMYLQDDSNFHHGTEVIHRFLSDLISCFVLRVRLSHVYPGAL